MKTTLKIAGIALIMMATVQISFAQGRMDPSQRAQMLTQRMEQQITGLSDTQKDSIQVINNDFAKAMSDVFQNSNGDRDAMRAAMGPIRDDREKRLKAVLTDDQYKQYQDMMQNMRRNYNGGGGGNGGN
jgi:periplasmic protein CpxP/Spy